jgi:hypothetical protein
LEIDLLKREDIVMTGFTTFLILILLFVLRFGIPFIVTIGFCHLMERFNSGKAVTPIGLIHK